MFKFVDLFCGTGGIRLGMEQAFKEKSLPTLCVKSAEIDKKVCETYQLNFFFGENPLADVKDIDGLEPFDILLAGFPAKLFHIWVNNKALPIPEAHCFLRLNAF
ncbi:MAG: DNA cytosine methyltransferase [Deinococcales bacterium]